MKLLLLFSILFLSISSLEANPRAVATFNSMSLYWEVSGDAETECNVEYKVAGSDLWKPAIDLWWAKNEYRGSVLGLEPGTKYEFRLSKGGKRVSFSHSTWSESFKIASEKRMASSSSHYAIREGGSESRGYAVYDFKDAVVDVKGGDANCLRIDSDYVIVRNGTFLGASESAIVVGTNRHHVIIESVIVENWGGRAEGYEVSDRVGGVTLREGCSQIVIQGCRIRYPRYDAWDWAGGNGAPAGEDHPHGAFGIACPDEPSRLSNNVFRYNHLEGMANRRLEDGMGAFSGNFSEQGFPGPDSDIYRNHIEYCVDNAIESEGGGKNIRVYENYMDHVYTPLGTKAVSLGPAYFLRNIAWRSLPVKGRSMKFFKAGGDGMRYFFHNMTLSDAADCYNRGIDTEGAALFARNNVFVISSDGIGSAPFSIGSKESSDFEYNLSNAAVKLQNGSAEKHGIRAMPIFREGHGPGKIGKFQLSKSSPGYDQGVLVPNVNNDYEGSAPDVGAHEFGSPAMRFGPLAWKNGK